MTYGRLMISLWTVSKPNHELCFLSDTDYKILKSNLPTIKSNEYEQRIPQHWGCSYVHACTLHRYTCAGEDGMGKLIKFQGQIQEHVSKENLGHLMCNFMMAWWQKIPQVQKRIISGNCIIWCHDLISVFQRSPCWKHIWKRAIPNESIWLNWTRIRDADFEKFYYGSRNKIP